MSENPKVVFDTQIYLRAAINPSSVCGKLFAEWTPYYILFVSDGIEAEILNVFGRSKIRAKFPQITETTLRNITSTLARSERVELDEGDIIPISRDPKDDIFLACAKAAKADYLVSEDNDLLVLKNYSGATILNALDFLSVLQNR